MSMKSNIAALLIAGAMMSDGLMAGNGPTRKRGSGKSELTLKQKQNRSKAKAAKKARKSNR